MAPFIFNNENKNDIVKRIYFGYLPRWQACIIDYAMASLMILITCGMYVSNGLLGVISTSVMFAIGFLIARSEN